MPTAAAPAYLGPEFPDASPGMRFGLLLPIWTTRADQERDVNQRAGAKSREGDEARELLRRGMDHAIDQLSNRNRRPMARLWAKSDADAREAWEHICPLKAHRDQMVAVARRQSALAAPLIAQGHLFAIDAQSVAPFTTGLGNEHPLENGFAFLNPYGLPYLAGSGVKGVLRQAARELAGGEWGDAQGWTEDAITWLFGLQSGDGDKVHQRGALVFWDVMPQLAGDQLQVDVMTPHQSHYYQGKSEARSGGSASPHDSGQPNPIHFLTVPPGSGFTFHVQCDLPLLRRHASALAEGQRWQALLQAAFEHAFAWLGFGAKTAVGYGAMREDERARQRREAARAAAEAEAAAAAQQARLAALSPEDRAWEEAQPVIEAFRAQLAKAKGKAYRPGGPFDEARLAFLKTALGWTEPRSRQAAGQALAETATRDWGRPSKAERWAELRATIAQLTGAA